MVIEESNEGEKNKPPGMLLSPKRLITESYWVYGYYNVIVPSKVPILSYLLHCKQRDIDITYCFFSGFAKKGSHPRI